MADFTSNPIWISKMERRFDGLDLNKNGYLEKKDFEIYAKNLAKIHKVGSEKEEYYFKRVSALFYNDDDGKSVSKKEFVEKMKKLVSRKDAKDVIREYCEGLCEILDVNNDKRISLPELKALLEAANLDKKIANKIFAVADTDRDGYLSFEEYHEILLKIFLTAEDVF